MRLYVVAAGLAALAAVLPGPPPPAVAAGPTAERDALFAGSEVLDLHLELGKAESDALRRDPRKYVRATLKAGEKSYADVGVHLKGAAGSFRGLDDKPGLTLNMDKFVDDQRFRGLDKFHLSNSVQDPSYLSELICGELFRAAGVPASRVAHATVTINGRPRGLYYLKEGYDKAFLRKHFGNSNGNFYDGGFLRDIDQPLQLVSGKGDVADRADLKALVKAAREPDPRRRFEQLERLLDLDKFLSFLAVEVIAWDWDGYPMKCNNYRIYHDPARNKLTFIPSGMDQMFGDVNGTMFPDFPGMVARGLVTTPEGRARYVARMGEILRTVYKPDELVRRLDELQTRLQPVLAKFDKGAARDYPNQVNRLKDAIKQRPRRIEEQLARLRK